ncbi:hypothetical protein C1H46_016366 [Malus baccata]|uniref:U11/U12 small nuclear ribonucleoprotein 35 kDa protein n=1 Tax=Malus baccata TaxID=106549 RepID=A0A540MIK9_MALBA|nr:hypothetical protein C1H46_016366 [Malus baccata]
MSGGGRNVNGNLNAVFYAEAYHPIQAGSIDGTDTLPHDNAVYRAFLCSSAGLYDPQGDPKLLGDPYCTLFVGHLSHLTTERTLRKAMSKYGQVKNLRLVRHIVTGASRGYAFVEYETEREMQRAYKEAHHSLIDDSKVIVDYNRQQLMPGWIPRRLGGGFCGKKESGQLRFGGREKPFRAPLRPIPYDELERLGIPPPPEGRYMSPYQTGISVLTSGTSPVTVRGPPAVIATKIFSWRQQGVMEDQGEQSLMISMGDEAMSNGELSGWILGTSRGAAKPLLAKPVSWMLYTMPQNNELVRTQTLVKSAIVQVDAAPFKQWYLQHYGVEIGRKKKSAVAKKDTPEEGEGTTEEAKKSNHVARKLEKRQQGRTLDPHIEEQFGGGRLLACISSRPGQCGGCDGYILEGKELEFYMKKLQRKKGKGDGAAA